MHFGRQAQSTQQSMADATDITRRTWLPAEAKRRLSVHGKAKYVDPVTTRSSPALSRESQPKTSSGGHTTQDAAGKGNCSQLISPNTPLDCGHDFSDTTLSGQSPSAASPTRSQEVNSKPSLLPSQFPAPRVPREPLGKNINATTRHHRNRILKKLRCKCEVPQQGAFSVQQAHHGACQGSCSLLQVGAEQPRSCP